MSCACLRSTCVSVLNAGHWLARKETLSDAVDQLPLSWMLPRPLLTLLAAVGVWLVWAPVGYVFALVSRGLTPGLVFVLCVLGVWAVGRTVARTITFPGSAPFIMRSIEADCAERQRNAIEMQLVNLSSAVYVRRAMVDDGDLEGGTQG